MLRKILIFWVVIMAIGCTGMGKTSAKSDAPRMTKEQLKAKLGAPELVVLDVRSGQDWKAGEGKIAGAVREDPESFDRWAAKYPKQKTLVLYCA